MGRRSAIVNTRKVDDRGRVLLAPDCEPGSHVTIEQIDRDTWLVRRHREQTKLKMVQIPVIRRLPDDPEWDKAENALARAAYAKLPPPPED